MKITDYEMDVTQTYLAVAPFVIQLSRTMSSSWLEDSIFSLRGCFVVEEEKITKG